MSRFLILTSMLLTTFLISLNAQAACDSSNSPHSFDCQAATFRGEIFPVSKARPGSMDGRWKLFVATMDPSNSKPAFRMAVNPNNPRIPEGVLNASDGTFTGAMVWTPRTIAWASFGKKGVRLDVSSGPKQIDDTTFDFKMKSANTSEGFQCRIFVRSGTDHMLCRWFHLNSDNTWVFQGFLGLLLF